MTKYLKFEKTDTGKWYIVLPGWTGSKDDLEMVMGADRLLDHLDYQGRKKIEIRVTSDRSEGMRLNLSELGEPEIGGAFYDVYSPFSGLHPGEIWLCDVTKYVLGEFPEVLYFDPINY